MLQQTLKIRGIFFFFLLPLCSVGHKPIILWINSLPLYPPSWKIPSLSSFLPVSLWGSSFLLMSVVSAHSVAPSQLGAPQPPQTSNQTEKQSIACCFIFLNPSVHNLLCKTAANTCEAWCLILKYEECCKCRQTLSRLILLCLTQSVKCAAGKA